VDGLALRETAVDAHKNDCYFYSGYFDNYDSCCSSNVVDLHFSDDYCRYVDFRMENGCSFDDNMTMIRSLSLLDSYNFDDGLVAGNSWIDTCFDHIEGKLGFVGQRSDGTYDEFGLGDSHIYREHNWEHLKSDSYRFAVPLGNDSNLGGTYSFDFHIDPFLIYLDRFQPI
jgi:hypothetical protein